jgi:Protein of unknown function DUF58
VSGPTELTFPLTPRRRLVGLAFGSVNSAKRGQGSNVASSRPYQPGDTFESIDWAASAKISTAHGQDEFIVREHYAEEAPRVVIVCDRRPAMELYPPGFPWLSKPRVMLEAGSMIADSAAKARGLIGYLDFASGNADGHAGKAGMPSSRHRERRLGGNGAEPPFWRPPHGQTDFWRVKESDLVFPLYLAPEDNLDRAFLFLAPLRRSLPAGTFVFVLSDFLNRPSTDSWATILEMPWEIVPVVIQDPVWEQSFPDVGSVVVPLMQPGSSRKSLVRLSRREAQGRRAANEQRTRETLADLEALGLEPIVLTTSDRDEIFTRFLEWVELRRSGTRAWL